MFHVNHPEPGAEIHHRDPFTTPEHERSPARRLRGRLAAPVTLWTAGSPSAGREGHTAGSPSAGREGHTAGSPSAGREGWSAPIAGLTVASTMVADGDPPRLLGVLDGESDLWAAIDELGRFAVAPLGPAHRQLADRFAGLMPAPGGLFKGMDWQHTAYGPVLPEVTGWAGCRVDDVRPCGWGLLVQATIESVTVSDGDDPGPLIHYRGRYRVLAGTR
ncbi:flavin reductase family protein [Solwaraspora sp. WMMB335]|uniref:flavin reductase family protein n=1 Tax=Solwaraspora sp. WMMB335 TaxID=3404118 RepID=UPI003B9603F2